MNKQNIGFLLTDKLWEDPNAALKILEENQEDLLWLDTDALFPSQTFIVDQFPRVLRYPASDTLEIFYDKCKKNELLMKKYAKIEERYLEVIQQLWGLSDVIIYSNIVERIDQLLEQFPSEKSYFDRLLEKTKKKQEQFISLDTFDDIEFLTKLSLKDKVCSCFVFKKIKMTVWINGLVLKVFVVNKDDRELLNLICTTHGLYVRQRTSL
ncbi:hypothetical protein [Paenibacillus thiaminolyticus]|uniref:Uncharacterized protein n=1 Tax=Paenibacillus thiaminolyticus TaxID=49283 RepID=A0A3A3GAY6_PANTH|nr:hypothetical protein [Paenibacillus thiaminolyticus]RJG20606.1 hypothetical protein DQX05_24460 [Paenibacillus thiaminolyticus]